MRSQHCFVKCVDFSFTFRVVSGSRLISLLRFYGEAQENDVFGLRALSRGLQ